MNIRSSITSRLQDADRAMVEWEQLSKKYEVTPMTKVVFFPKEIEEVQKYGVMYLDTHLIRMGMKDAIIIYTNDFVREMADTFCSRVKEYVKYNDAEMERFITLYSLFLVDSRISIVSLDKPYCRWADRLVGVNGITAEQLVAIGVYGIIPFRSIYEE